MFKVDFFSSASIIDFEQLNPYWAVSLIRGTLQIHRKPGMSRKEFSLHHFVNRPLYVFVK